MILMHAYRTFFKKVRLKSSWLIESIDEVKMRCIYSQYTVIWYNRVVGLVGFGIRVEKSNLWNSPLSFNPQIDCTVGRAFPWIASFQKAIVEWILVIHISAANFCLMMVMLPGGVVYRFTLSVSIWLFLPSVMYEVVTRGLTEPIDFCQQSRNCKNLIKVVGTSNF